MNGLGVSVHFCASHYAEYHTVLSVYPLKSTVN